MIGDCEGDLNMAFHVQREVIATREATIAVTTLERFGPGVLSIVAG